MAIQTYDPSQVDLYLAILYPATGFSPDSLITITKDQGYFNTSKGVSGGVERTLITDNTYTLEVSLSQTSPTNSILNALATLDNLSGYGVFPIFAKDSSGNSNFIADSCWIENPPETRYTTNIESRVWRIRCSNMIFNLAGNSEDRNALEKMGQLTNLIGQFGGNYGLF